MERQWRRLLFVIFICAVVIEDVSCKCSKECIPNSECINDKCKCETGFYGTHCEKLCTNCDISDKNIKCQENPQNRTDIICGCKSPIFHPIDDNVIETKGCKRKECNTNADCNNNGECHPKTFTCKCDTKFFGDKCDGLCSTDCAEENNLKCVEVDGKRVCQCVDTVKFLPIGDANKPTACKSKSCKDAHFCKNKIECREDGSCKCPDELFGLSCEKSCEHDCTNKGPRLECRKSTVDANLQVCGCSDKALPKDPTDPIAQGCYSIEDCTEFQCLNGGNCKDDLKCECDKDHYGFNCGVSCESKCPSLKNLKCEASDRNNEATIECKCLDDTYKADGDLNKDGSCFKDPCNPNPCHGGKCEIKDKSPKCSCPKNFFGDLCEIDCEKTCVPAHGLVCVEDKTAVPNGFICGCKPQYAENGPNLPTDGCHENKCLTQSIDCKNNGECLDKHPNDPICNCSVNYFGATCEINCITECPADGLNLTCKAESSDPTAENKFECDCINEAYEFIDGNDKKKGCHKKVCFDPKTCGDNGKCEAKDRNEVCECTAGYYGPKCEVKCEDECKPDDHLVCVKIATAPESENAMECGCKPDYKPKADPNTIRDTGCIEDLCVRHTCANGGTCDDSSRQAKCICPEDVFGEVCDVQCNDVCPTNLHLICNKNDTTPNGYDCSCKKNYVVIDKTVKIEVSGCRQNVCESEGGCKNGGTCDKDNGLCECKSDYFGPQCEKSCKDLCSGANLKCVPNSIDKFNATLVTCDCVSGDYIPHNNKNLKEGCFEDLCKKQSGCSSGNGECEPMPNNAICTCNPGFHGKQCEKSCKTDACKDQLNTQCTIPVPPDNDVECECINGFISESKYPEEKGCKDDVCSKISCNYGTCKEIKGVATCECKEGYFLPNCIEDCNDICKGQPNTECQKDKKECHCKKDYVPVTAGKIPEDGCRIDHCKSHNCEKGSKCNDTDGFAKCDCPADFFGKTCSDSCEKNCPKGKNLRCEKDTMKPDIENAVKCLCTDDSFIPEKEDDISKGCKKDTCKNNPCSPGGSVSCEIVSETDYRCICKKNYFGQHCKEICGKICNKPNLVCKMKNENDKNNAYECECKSDYREIGSNAETGGCSKKCTVDTDCDPNAMCTDKKFCKCNDTFTLSGDICLPASVPCNCRNGGVCDKDGKCKCLEGFAGTNCEVLCDSACGPNAVCVGETNAIKCSACLSSYVNVSTTERTNCVFDNCTKNTPCKNGKCKMLPNGDYSCECATDEYIDKDCSTKCIDVCGSNTKCSMSSGAVACNCIEGYENIGANFPKLECVESLCKTDTCRNGGMCKMGTKDKTTCTCPIDFIGENCECKRYICDNKCEGDKVKCISDCNNYACKCTNSSQSWDIKNNKCVDIDFCKYITCDSPNQKCKDGECQCKVGYELSKNSCGDKFNLCATNPCSGKNMKCINEEPERFCVCEEGYYLSNGKCEKFHCEHICQFGQKCDARGECECPPGFKHGGNKECTGLKDCKIEEQKKFGENTVCYLDDNNQEQFLCASGYKKDNNKCININECLIDGFKLNCEMFGGECRDTEGSYECDCGANSYDKENKICLPVNECETKKHNCDPHSTECDDEVNGFKCLCKDNYELPNGTHCKPKDKCISKPCRGLTAKCQNNVFLTDGYECICPFAEKYDSTLGCVNAKQIYPGQIKLAKKFDNDLTNSSSLLYFKTKTEVEAALSDTMITTGGQIVVKVIGFKEGSTIAVYDLYSEDPLTYQAVGHMLKEQCQELPDDKTTCLLGGTDAKVLVRKEALTKEESNLVETQNCPVEAIRLCSLGNSKCSPNPNDKTSFFCSCEPGFEEKYSAGGTTVCADINECDRKPCGESEDCHNTRGSYHCHCKEGYSRIPKGPKGTCKKTCEVNPCDKGTCVKLSTTGWRCDCDVGYIGEKCDTEHSQLKTSKLGWEVAVGVLAAAFAFCFIVSCLIIKKLKRKLKNSSPYDDSQLNDYTSQSTNNLAPTKNGRRMNEYDNPPGP